MKCIPLQLNLKKILEVPDSVVLSSGLRTSPLKLLKLEATLANATEMVVLFNVFIFHAFCVREVFGTNFNFSPLF